MAAYALYLAPTARELEALRTGLERTTGLHVVLQGPVETRMLPRPMIVAHEVAISGEGEAIALESGTARGILSLPDLVLGRAVLASLTLTNVTGSLDADAVAWPAGDALPVPAGATSSAAFRPAAVTLDGGLIQIRSSRASLNGFLGDLHAAFEGLRGGAGGFSAHASWHGERADISGRLDSLVHVFQGKQASGSVHVRSHAITASLSGTWLDGWRGFKGNVTAATPSLPSLLRLGGIEPGAFIGIERVSFSGSADTEPAGIAFDSARVVINDDPLEGTLGLQNHDGRWMLAGTLATDKLDVSSFAAVLPAMRADGSWSEAPIPLAPRDLHDLDLRLSVGRLQLGQLHADDAALSLLCSDGRMELSLGEARAYGGMLKARLFAAGEARDLTVKSDVSWSQLDVSRISQAVDDAAGSGWTGTTSGSVTTEGRGGSARAVISSLEGKGQTTWQQGQIGASRLVSLLFRPGSVEAVPSPLRFDLGGAAFSLSNGVATIGTASINGPDGTIDLQGETSLVRQTYSLSAVVGNSTDAAAGGEGAPRETRGVHGAWSGHPRFFSPVVPSPTRSPSSTTAVDSSLPHD